MIEAASFKLDPGRNNISFDVPVTWNIETRAGIRMKFPVAARAEVVFDMPPDGGDFARIEVDIPENAPLGTVPLRVVK